MPRFKHTPWFEGTTNPDRVGWYERAFKAGRKMQQILIRKSFWNGYEWLEGTDDNMWLSAAQHVPWRGIKDGSR